jgi:hypothetical protein
MFGSIFAAAGAVAMDNMMKRIREQRCHNLTQVVHEVLADHLIAYPPFFVALVIGADYRPNVLWGSPKDFIGFFVIVAFIFYAIGVYLTTLHDEMFVRHHKCTGFKACTLQIGWRDASVMFFPTVLFSAVLFLAGGYFALTTY